MYKFSKNASKSQLKVRTPPFCMPPDLSHPFYCYVMQAVICVNCLSVYCMLN